MTVANFDLNYLSYFIMNFKNSCAYLVANFLNFVKLPQHLQLGWVEANKITKTKWELNCGTPCMMGNKWSRRHRPAKLNVLSIIRQTAPIVAPLLCVPALLHAHSWVDNDRVRAAGPGARAGQHEHHHGWWQMAQIVSIVRCPAAAGTTDGCCLSIRYQCRGQRG